MCSCVDHILFGYKQRHPTYTDNCNTARKLEKPCLSHTTLNVDPLQNEKSGILQLELSLGNKIYFYGSFDACINM